MPGAPSACAHCSAAPYCLCTPSHSQGRDPPQPRKVTEASSTRQNQLQGSHAPHIYSFQCSFWRGGKVASIIHQNLSFWEQSLGRALEGVSCFGVSSPRQPWGRQELSCLHALCSTHRNTMASGLEDTWSPVRAILPGILGWAALSKFIFHKFIQSQIQSNFDDPCCDFDGWSLSVGQPIGIPGLWGFAKQINK